MFLLLSLIIISSFKSFFSLNDEYISNCNYNLKTIKNYTLRSTSKSNETNCDCLPRDLKNITNITYAKITICVLKCWKNEPAQFIVFVNNLKGIIQFFDLIELEKMGKLIVNITKKIVNNDYMIEQINDIINTTNFTDLMIELLNNSRSWENINKNYTYDFLSRLLNITGIIPLFESLYNTSRTDILDLIEEFFLRYYSDIGNIFGLFRKKLDDILDDTLIFVFEIIKNFKDNNKVIDLITDFIIKHNNTFDRIKEVMLDDKMKVFYELLVFRDDIKLIQTKNLIISKKETLEMIINIMGNKDCLLLGNEILKNRDNMTIIKEKIPNLISLVLANNNTIIDPLTELIFSFLFDASNEKDKIVYNIFNALQSILRKTLTNLNYNNYNISDDCIELFNYTYFLSSIKPLFFLYFQKYLFDSSRHNGDFLPFDNCLDDSYKIKTSTKYNISPAFVIGIINEFKLKENSKDSSFYFKYNYFRSFCFPFGYKNEEEKIKNNPMCSDKDYEKIISLLYGVFNNINESNITVFSINKSNKTPSALYNFYGVLGILFLGFPILTYIFLLISGKIIEKKQRKINGNNTKQQNNKNELIEMSKGAKTKKIIYPKWYQYLNEFFNIKNNISELFNFSLNITNYNNFKGLTYIKGIVGISIILTVFGQTFITLLNLPSKGYGIWDYYLMMSSPFYFILFLGYRYCPRILFSCTGYILIYKYLFYIEEKQGLYFLKFVFLQSYKYILLIFFVIIIRYPLYYIVFLMRQSKRPTWEIFKHFIDKEGNFFKHFFTFLIYPKESDNSIKQNLIFYYYIPINEVLFFILGTGLISLGYKFKLRIDIFIFVLILLIYVLKIILYIVYKNENIKAYSTTDYYLFGYGLNLINPLFNFNYFLIGMFFGLINYSIQKGITDLEKNNNNNNNNYPNIFALEDSKNINDDDNDNDNESQTIRKLSTFSHDDISIGKIELNLDNVSKTDESLISIYRRNNKLINKKNYTMKKSKNNRTNDIKDINRDSNEIFEKFNKLGEMKECSEKIKQMPFLILPVKFSNFHKKYINKLIINIIIIIGFLLFLFLIGVQFTFTCSKLKIGQYEKDLVEKLSFKTIISDIGLNIILLMDIEIAVFIIQWINFILYFKEVGIIKNFLNHVYWSIFIKSYFSFNLISITVILFIFFITETVIKFNFSNIFLYALIDLILTLFFTIAFYSCFELPFKKVFKLFLKGKGDINNEENNDEYEEEENNEDEEEKHLKDENDEE